MGKNVDEGFLSQQSKDENESSSKYRPWRDYLENILVAVFLALIVRTYIWTGYKVPTGSMAPTLKPGDFIFAYKLPYGVRLPFMESKISGLPPRRGDIVVFTYPEQPRTNYVKRVVGLPGDVIEIQDRQLIINGKSLVYKQADDSAISDLPSFEIQTVLTEVAPEGARTILALKEAKKKSFGPIVISPGEVFLLGDNRDASDDSRYWGTVPIERIEGRVSFIWLSLNWQQAPSEDGRDSVGSARFPQVRWERVFTKPDATP
jgi:signal peptidase I